MIERRQDDIINRAQIQFLWYIRELNCHFSPEMALFFITQYGHRQDGNIMISCTPTLFILYSLTFMVESTWHDTNSLSTAADTEVLMQHKNLSVKVLSWPSLKGDYSWKLQDVFILMLPDNPGSVTEHSLLFVSIKKKGPQWQHPDWLIVCTPNTQLLIFQWQLCAVKCWLGRLALAQVVDSNPIRLWTCC